MGCRTLDKTASRVDLKFIMVTISKDVFSHKGHRIRHILLCHNGSVYSYKTKVNFIFPKVSCNIKTKIIIRIIM